MCVHVWSVCLYCLYSPVVQQYAEESAQLLSGFQHQLCRRTALQQTLPCTGSGNQSGCVCVRVCVCVCMCVCVCVFACVRK